jgi:hypothetical protein
LRRAAIAEMGTSPMGEAPPAIAGIIKEECHMAQEGEVDPVTGGVEKAARMAAVVSSKAGASRGPVARWSCRGSWRASAAGSSVRASTTPVGGTRARVGCRCTGMFSRSLLCGKGG